jgi:hypothetical protein
MAKLLSLLLTITFAINAFSETRLEKIDRLEKEMTLLQLNIQNAKNSRKNLVRLTVLSGAVSVIIGGVGGAMVSGNNTGDMARIVTHYGKLVLLGDLVPVAVTAGGAYLISLNSKQLEKLEKDVNLKTDQLKAAKSVLLADEEN